MATEVSRARLTQLLDRYVGRCTPDLFAAYREDLVPTTARDGSSGNYSLAGVVGFVGDISGTLLLGTTPEVLIACHPLRRACPITEHLQLDWIGELANQLMGRLKLRLGAHGVTLRVSPPISLAGDRMRHAGAAGDTYRAAFRYGQLEIDVWIDALIDDVLSVREEFFDDGCGLEPREGTVFVF